MLVLRKPTPARLMEGIHQLTVDVDFAVMAAVLTYMTPKT